MTFGRVCVPESDHVFMCISPNTGSDYVSNKKPEGEDWMNHMSQKKFRSNDHIVMIWMIIDKRCLLYTGEDGGTNEPQFVTGDTSIQT